MTGWAGTEDCLSRIVGCAPTAVLDAGSGSGLWGCLLRHYLDAGSGRIQPEQWRTRIDAVEPDPLRVPPYADRLYTEIVIGDPREVVPRRATEVRYDVILFDELLDQLYKDDGRALLEVAAGLAGRLVLVRIRLGGDWFESAFHSAAPSEADLADRRRLSYWSAKDFTEHDFAGHPGELQRYEMDAPALVTIGCSG